MERLPLISVGLSHVPSSWHSWEQNQVRSMETPLMDTVGAEAAPESLLCGWTGAEAMQVLPVCQEKAVQSIREQLARRERQVYTSEKPETLTPGMNSVEEEEVEDGNMQWGSSYAMSQDLFETPLQSWQSSMGKPDAGKGILAAAVVAWKGSLSTPVEHLSQIRRTKKRTQNDIFCEILQASVAPDPEQRAWQMNIAECMERERVNRPKGPVAQQVKEREMHQDIMELLWQHTDAADSCGLASLCSLENCNIAPPYLPDQHSTGHQGPWPSRSTLGGSKDNHSITYTESYG
ncbi:uncharacterized protein LOC123346996 [Mauremys mutica]|uniref:uncharacterized protein LOC123346996 n=1 Tax=Mauremys mutica TaxID=74926 RepID=UPI001D16A472|nr:uncharacterized protein LOC123346996 [Mauremys mutica]